MPVKHEKIPTNKERNEERNILKMNFMVFAVFLLCRYTTLVKFSSHSWSVFGAIIG